MSVKIKICGIKDRINLEVAVKAGADFIGFVFFPKSPRNLGIQDAVALASLIKGRTQSVALCVDASDDLIREINENINPDWFQLHGKETPGRVSEIKNLVHKPVIKALGVENEGDILKAEDYKNCVDLILFDAKPVADVNALPGGNGIPFDWTLLKNVEKQMEYMLSGGLKPKNVRSAIELTGASAVDVSSGVEKRPGAKDPQLIRRFIAEARSAGKTINS